MHLYIERFGLEFTAKNDIPFRGFSSDAVSILKQYSWPGNVRELKNSIESLLVMNKGQRIDGEMIKSHLNIVEPSFNENAIIPITDDADKLERELILKQLLYLRQDINEIKQFLTDNSSGSEIAPTNPAFFLPIDESNGRKSSF